MNDQVPTATSESSPNYRQYVIYGILGFLFFFQIGTCVKATSEQQRVVRARKFILEDKTGRPLAELKKGKGAGNLYIYDENGNIRIGITAAKTKAGISLSSEGGVMGKGYTPHVSMGTGKTGRKGFIITDEKGNPVLGIVESKDGTGILLKDRHGNTKIITPKEK